MGEEAEDRREGYAELVDALEGVVEVDDASGTDMARARVDDLLWHAVGAVVEGVKVEHHYEVSGVRESFLLAWQNQSVRGTEKP